MARKVTSGMFTGYDADRLRSILAGEEQRARTGYDRGERAGAKKNAAALKKAIRILEKADRDDERARKGGR